VKSKQRLLAGVLALAAVGGGVVVWHLVGGERIELDEVGSATSDGRAHDDVEPAGADAAESRGRSASTEGVAAASAAPSAPPDEFAPQRQAEPVPLVDVHGWFILARATASDPALERGHVVLASVVGSPTRCRVKATVANGTFDVKLPKDAIVKVVELSLGDSPTIFENQLFDLAKSRWLEVHAAWMTSTTIRVVDPSGREVTGLTVLAAEEMGGGSVPLPLERLLPPEGKEVATLDSPLRLVPRFEGSNGGRWQWSERLQIGAPGFGTQEVEILHGGDEPIVVELRAAVKLTVRLRHRPGPEPPSTPIEIVVKPWSGPRHGSDDRVLVGSGASGKQVQRVLLPVERTAVGRRALAPDERGEAIHEDLPPGRWLVTVESLAPNGGKVIVRDGVVVDLPPGADRLVELDASRTEAARARLVVKAHDAPTGEAIRLEDSNLRVRARGDGSQLSLRPRGMEGPPPPSMDPSGAFELPAGVVSVALTVLDGDRAWLPIEETLELLPGDNEVDFALARTSAVRVRWRGSESARARCDELRVRPEREATSRDTDAASLVLMRYLPTPWGEGLTWFLPPARYELFVRLPDGATPTIKTVDVESEKVVDLDLSDADFTAAGIDLDR
jgi:hypothetical protein